MRIGELNVWEIPYQVRNDGILFGFHIGNIIKITTIILGALMCLENQAQDFLNVNEINNARGTVNFSCITIHFQALSGVSPKKIKFIANCTKI